jgi:hypothetical protein
MNFPSGKVFIIQHRICCTFFLADKAQGSTAMLAALPVYHSVDPFQSATAALEFINEKYAGKGMKNRKKNFL